MAGERLESWLYFMTQGDFYYVLQTDEGFESGLLQSFSSFQYSSFGEDLHGELYVALRGEGEIHKVTDVSDCRPVARIKGDTLLSLPEEETITLKAFYHPSLEYQWRKNGEPIEEATSHLLEVNDHGVFTVEVTNPDNDCQNTSDPVEVMVEEPTFITDTGRNPVRIYPNPAQHQITIEGLPWQGMVSIQLLDSTGNIVVSENHYATETVLLKTSELPKGMYILNLTTESFARSWKVVLGK